MSFFFSDEDTPRKYAPLPKKLHQIWFGDSKNMSDEVRKGIASVQKWCDENNIEYKLWGWVDVCEMFYDDACTPVFEKCMVLRPCKKLYVLESDYYRWAITASFGGVYIDTDFLVNRTPKIPEADLVFITPHRDRTPGNGVIWCNGDKGKQAAAVCRKLANYEIACTLGSADKFEENLDAYLGRNIAMQCIGPGFLNNVMLPALQREGYTWKNAGLTELGCWRKDAAFYHFGEAAWRN